MKMDFKSPFNKKKKLGRDKNSDDMDIAASAGESSGSDLNKIAFGGSMPQAKAGLDMFEDSDNDEIFDDDDDDDVAVNQHTGTPLDISELLSGGVNAIVAPIKNAINSNDDHSQNTGDSDDNISDNDSYEDTESEDEKDQRTKHKNGNGSDSGEDYTDDEDEGEDGYKPGGYHRVKAGEVYNQR
jgi:hypothetical protein